MLQQAIKDRRSYYSISDNSPLSNKEIKEIVDLAIKHVPSAFNSQSTRVVLLLGEHHKKLWDITKDELQKIISADAFAVTKEKIETSFQSGYGTVLFFEDQSVVKSLQEQFPSYSANFPVWSEHTSAMHQYAVWMMLEEAGFGASLQHYHPLINEGVAKTWDIHPEWKLVAQMPFGMPIGEPGKKEFKPLEDRSLIFE